ncbi:MAG: hypothetical protein Q7J54_01150 [Candidatus Woesearchaeota archaeon]|nr:hypothetical protein [Candidatus Woesearchaeota archaeon]
MNLASNNNIVELVRKPYSVYRLDSIPTLYTLPLRKLDTRKGQWEIHEREKFVIPFFLGNENQSALDGFCAVYFNKKGKPQTIFLGNLDDIASDESRGIVDSTAIELSKKVLEQRLFSWPPRGLDEKNGEDWCISNGLLAGLIAGSGILIDGAVAGYGNSSGRFEYTSMISKLTKLANENPNTLPILLWSMAGILFSLGSLGLIGMGGKIGKFMDNIRIKNLPKESRSFSYGHDAVDSILHEQETVKRENEMRTLYNELQNSGYSVPKPLITEIYDAMKAIDARDSCKIISLRDHLAKKAPIDLPVCTLTNAYLAATGK